MSIFGLATWHAERMRRIILSSVVCLAVPNFSTLSHRIFMKTRQVVAGLFRGDRQTDGLAHIAMLIVAFHSFANVPKMFSS